MRAGKFPFQKIKMYSVRGHVHSETGLQRGRGVYTQGVSCRQLDKANVGSDTRPWRPNE